MACAAAALGVGDGKGDQGEDEHQHTADEQRFLLARALAEEGLIEVRREGAGGDEQLRIRRGDGRGDDGCEQQTADARREELAGHGDENELLVAVGEQLLAHDHAPEIRDHNGGEEGNDDPDDGHDRGLLDHRGLLDGHEAHKDVRHTEVAETPAEAADDVLPARVEDAAAESALRHRAGRSIGILIDRLQRRGIEQLAVAEIDDDRHQHQRRHHQKALEEICPAHGGRSRRRRYRPQ